MGISVKRLVGLAAGLLVAIMTSPVALGQADQVRWDIISLGFTTPPTFNPGGVSDAKAPDNTTIRFTGAGTFVAPAGRYGGNRAVRGGGTWQTFDAAGVSTGSGTYSVTGLVTWEFANLQTGAGIDNIANLADRANGSAVLQIEYSDSSQGILWVGCHGPGAPPGIFEGIAASKGFKTYDDVQDPAPGVDANRTIFHVNQ